MRGRFTSTCGIMRDSVATSIVLGRGGKSSLGDAFFSLFCRASFVPKGDRGVVAIDAPPVFGKAPTAGVRKTASHFFCTGDFQFRVPWVIPQENRTFSFGWAAVELARTYADSFVSFFFLPWERA